MEICTVKRRFSTTTFAILIAAVGVVYGGEKVLAQSQSQWDSLFDRMIRIEADMRVLKSNPGAQGSSGGGQLDQRFFTLENQMQQLLDEMRLMNGRLRRLETSGNRSDAARVPQNNLTTHETASPQKFETGDLPVAAENFNAYTEDNLVIDNGGSGTPVYTGSMQQAAPPTTLGTITTHTPQGEVPKYNESVEVATLDGQSVAGISSASGPQELYEQSYASMKKKQYSAAGTGFRDFVSRYRGHGLAGNAQYWLGQSYYARGEYHQAAKEFLAGYKAFKTSKKAPASLLKLGMSLRKLGKKDQACATLSQVGKQFPKAKSERKLASKEYKRAGC
jgi:tol-pal system protein YbgF